MASATGLTFSETAHTLVDASQQAQRTAEAFYAPVADHEVVVVRALRARVENRVFATTGTPHWINFTVEFTARCDNVNDSEPF